MRPDVRGARRLHPRAGLASLLVALALASCSDCSPQHAARDFAGEGAVDCGFAPLGTDPTAVHTCMLDAAEREVAYVGGSEGTSIDSVSTGYIASDGAGNTAIFAHDPLGANLSFYACPGPARLLTFTGVDGSPMTTVGCDPGGVHRELCR